MAIKYVAASKAIASFDEPHELFFEDPTNYGDLLIKVIQHAAVHDLTLKPINHTSVAALNLYRPVQAWEASRDGQRLEFIFVTEEDPEEQEVVTDDEEESATE